LAPKRAATLPADAVAAHWPGPFAVTTSTGSEAATLVPVAS
jgi:hypothetical protein